MPLSDLDGLLPALTLAFGEPCLWRPFGASPGSAPFAFPGRFRIDPQDASLGAGPGLNQTQTWVYVDRRDIPHTAAPGQGDCLLIRNVWWEIVQIDTDDLGELGYRLIKAADRDVGFNPARSVPFAPPR